MRWFVSFLILVAIALAFMIAFDDGQHLTPGIDQPADDATANPPPDSDDFPGDDPSLPVNASADQDPRDVLIQLIHGSNESGMEVVYDHLPSRFHTLEFDEDWVSLVDPRRRAGYIRSPDDLEVEEYNGYAIVRSTEIWMATWVFIVEDGEWRFDPGERYLLMASAMIQQGREDGFTYGMTAPEDYRAQSRSEPDDDSVTPFVRGRLHGVGILPEGVDVSMVWEYEFGRSDPVGEPVQSHLLQDVVIPLDQISWHVGDQSGGVEVRWTDGNLTQEELRLIGWPSEDVANEATGESETIRLLSYGATIRLLGVPEHAEEITLRFESVQVGPFGGDGPVPEGETIAYTWEFTFPARTTDPIMIGEAPEPAPSDDPIAMR